MSTNSTLHIVVIGYARQVSNRPWLPSVSNGCPEFAVGTPQLRVRLLIQQVCLSHELFVCLERRKSVLHLKPPPLLPIDTDALIDGDIMRLATAGTVEVFFKG